VIHNALKRAFAPEFLNRIDDVIVFNSLSRDDIHRIIDLELSKLFGRIESLGYGITLTDAAKDFLVDKGYDEQFGARPLRRALQKYLEDPLAEEIISAQLQEGDKIEGDAMEGQEELAIRIIKGKAPKSKKKSDKADAPKPEAPSDETAPEATEDKGKEEDPA
jgi:ATP-dependent Clp protease ATP-binding subunit ClpC